MNVSNLRRIGGGFIVGLGLLAFAGGCDSAGSQDRAQTPAVVPDDGVRTVTGTVRHIDLEGGFYGIVTDDGRRLHPVNLPQEFQQDGLRLRAQVEELTDRVSIHMWGTQVRIIEFQRLSPELAGR